MGLNDYLSGLIITQGAGAGEPLQLLPWQRRFVKGFERTEGDAALSVARGNGKTTLIAGIACAALSPGAPLVQPRAETIIVASSFTQGRIAYEHVLAFLRAAGHDLEDRQRWRLQDSANSATIEDRQSGARVRAIGSDPTRAMGLAPLLCVCDEPSSWPETTSDRMIAALRTSLGKIDGSRLIAIGTRPAGEHWFERMLSGGGSGYSQIHAARDSDEPFRRSTWAKANPSFAIMPALEKAVRREAQDAKTDPSLLQGFRALRLNLGTSDTIQSTLLDAGTWERAEGEAEHAGAFVLGIDLGGTASLSAASGFWPESGCLEAFGCFGTEPDLGKRGTLDGVGRLYLDMHRRGELILEGGRLADVGALLREVLERWGRPAAIVADRWRIAELADALDRESFPSAALLARGQGFRDGGADVLAFRQAVLGGRVTPRRSLLMRAAMSEARVAGDAAGNFKLTKVGAGTGKRSRGRDDAAAASILAVAAGEREAARAPRRTTRGVYLGTI